MFRISLYEPTLVERWITFQDAITMMRGNLLLGIGAGNWQEQQFFYQSAPYSVKYIHNYYLQLMLDGGLLAPLLFIATMLPAIIKGIRNKSVHAFILIAVLLNALMDIDLIFTAVSLIAMYSLSQLTKPGKLLNIGKFRYVALAPMLVIFSLWCSELFSSNADTQLERENLETSMRYNETALRLNPLNVGLYYQMAQSTRDVELSEQLLTACIEKYPRDLRAISILALVEADKGNLEAALQLCGRLIENRRFSDDYQFLYLVIAGQAVDNGVISNTDYEDIHRRLREINEQVNPLYKQYISGDDNT